MANVPLDPKKATKEQINKGLELLAKAEDRKERIKRGEIKGGQTWADMSEDQKDKRRDYNKRRRIRHQLIAKKAVEAGITVTDAEVDEYIAGMPA